MRDDLFWILVLSIIAIYFFAVMPIRESICKTQNMTAVWYISGCVIGEIK